MKNTQHGFTLVEALIVLAVLGMLAAIVDRMISGVAPSWASHTPRGTYCQAGYLHVGATSRQLIDDQGHGVKCDE